MYGLTSALGWSPARESLDMIVRLPYDLIIRMPDYPIRDRFLRGGCRGDDSGC